MMHIALTQLKSGVYQQEPCVGQNVQHVVIEKKF